MANYSVLLVAALIVLSLPVLTLFVLAPLVRASRPNKVKLEPYECGVPASSYAFDHRFSVRYFLIAVLFIIFDVETVFLFPWAIRFKQLGWFGAVEMAVFLAILLVGYFYAWKSGRLNLRTIRQNAARLRLSNTLFELIDQEAWCAHQNSLRESTSRAPLENS